MLIDLMEELRLFGMEMKEKEDDFIFRISINYYYDREGIDLGARFAVCDSEEENFRFEYYSLTLGEAKHIESILQYIKEEGREKEYVRLQLLAKDLQEELPKCDWWDRRTEIELIEYD